MCKRVGMLLVSEIFVLLWTNYEFLSSLNFLIHKPLPSLLSNSAHFTFVGFSSIICFFSTVLPQSFAQRALLMPQLNVVVSEGPPSKVLFVFLVLLLVRKPRTPALVSRVGRKLTD